MALTDGERRLLLGIGLVLLVGGIVRFISAVDPGWTPGLRSSGTPELRPPEEATSRAAAPFGTLAERDSLFLDGRLDLNACGAAHLELLPGIGPALASRIETRRTAVGGFRSVDDLLSVKGIGPKTLARLRPLVCVRTPPG